MLLGINTPVMREVNPIYLVGVVSTTPVLQGAISGPVNAISDKEISYEEGLEYARSQDMGFFEVRINDRSNLDEAIIRLIDESLLNALALKERFRLPKEMVPWVWFWRALFGGLLMIVYIFAHLMIANTLYFLIVLAVNDSNHENAVNYSEAIASGVFVGFIFGIGKSFAFLMMGLVFLITLPCKRHRMTRAASWDFCFHVIALTNLAVLAYTVKWLQDNEIPHIAMIVCISSFGVASIFVGTAFGISVRDDPRE